MPTPSNALPSFAMGGRPTKVVQVGCEYAAIYEDTLEVIDHFTCVDPEDAARRAIRAALPPEERNEDECCVGGCSRCLGVQGVVF